MNAIKILKSDHNKVAKLLKQAEDTTEKAIKTRRELFLKIKKELSIHEIIEERLFYPPLKEFEETRDLIFEAFEEHDLIDHLIKKTKKEDYDEEEWLAKLTLLKEVVKHHVNEEEKELFPIVIKIMDKKKLESLGEKMYALKEKLEREYD